MGSWGRAPGCSCRAGGGLGGPERHGTPARPERVADGGVRGRGARPPARSGNTKTAASSCRRGPSLDPCAPGLLPNPPSGTIAGVRPPGVGTLAAGPWASLARVARVPAALGGGARRGQPDPDRQRRWRRPRPRPPLPTPPSSPQPPRGSRLSPGVGAGPAG